jgi:hypothetical protein
MLSVIIKFLLRAEKEVPPSLSCCLSEENDVTTCSGEDYLAPHPGRLSINETRRRRA